MKIEVEENAAKIVSALQLVSVVAGRGGAHPELAASKEQGDASIGLRRREYRYSAKNAENSDHISELRSVLVSSETMKKRSIADSLATHQNQIVLVRGLPGSGKTTFAKTMKDGHVHFEADMFFDIEGIYTFEPSKVREAHDWCFESAKSSLKAGCNVIVSNTFIKLWEIKRYVELGYPFRIVEMMQRWGNIHGVPAETIERMSKNWQALPVEWKN